MTLVVRWMGAFGYTKHSLDEVVEHEIHGVLGRQVAAEPCFFGESRLSTGVKRAQIGLRVDLARSEFVRGWLGDAWTGPVEGGLLVASRRKDHRDGKAFNDIGRLVKAAKAFSRLKPGEYRSHGEVIIDCVKYDAVVVISSATPQVKARAKALADRHGLPLIVIPRHRTWRDEEMDV